MSQAQKGWTRFLHAFNFADATDEMVQSANDAIDTATAGIQAQGVRLTDVGLGAKALTNQCASLTARKVAANRKTTNNDRYAELCKVKTDAEAALDSAKDDIDAQLASAFNGISAAMGHLRDAASAQISKLEDDNASKQPLGARLTQLNKDIATANKITDRKVLRAKLAELEGVARALFDEAAAASGDTGAIKATYEKALEDRYGITVLNPWLHSNTHLDKVYKMFGAVPLDNVVHKRLKILNYNSLTIDEGTPGFAKDEASYGYAVINLADFGETPSDWEYKTPAEGFSITTLHEIGHSVDDRYGIMAQSQEKPGCGGWRKETVEQIADALYLDFQAANTPGAAETVSRDVVVDLMKVALKSGKKARPDGLQDPEWTAIEEFLGYCDSARTTNTPWYNLVHVGGRGYCESYGNDWWSYDTNQRTEAKTVRGYQWRSPGEWFAELYAYSWFKQEAPPRGIDAAVAAYMWSA